MKIINPVRIDRISFADGSYAELQRPTIMSEHTTELLIDYLNLMMKKVRFQYEDQLKKDEDQLKQEALESLLFEQE